MNESAQIDEGYRTGTEEEHIGGEVVDVDPSLLGGYSAAPTGEDRRPAFERRSYAPQEVSFNQIMELWAAHEGGTLKRVTHRYNESEGYGEDDARAAWDWVAGTPGWNPVVHEVMRHLVLRAKSWEQWPRAHVVKLLPRPHCPWPPCGIPYETAGKAWGPFYRELRKRYRREPFTVKAQVARIA